MQREKLLKRLDEDFDIIIIGGGITGVGAARDAAYRGLKVAVLEMNDLAYGTSSRSSKLVHGGLRYLENLEFSLVFEAVSERQTLMNIAPHLVHPLGFLFPVFQNSRRSGFTINLGMWLYDGLSLFRSPKIHQNLSKKEVYKIEPALDGVALKKTPLYYDCSTDDARLTLETGLDAIHYGAVICTYMKVASFVLNEQGKIVGVKAVDQLDGTSYTIKGHAVINCTGPWSDDTRLLGREGKGYLRPTKGVHIVVDHAKLPINNAVVCFHPKDGRVLFAIPWGDRSYIGTTDTDLNEALTDIAATNADVIYLLEASNHYFPKFQLQEQDVISTWAGVRPLIANMDADSESESSVSREHSVLIEPNGLITIAGGKLTTYRRMAAEVVDKAVDLLCITKHLPNKPTTKRDTSSEPLPGAKGWPTTEKSVKELHRQLIDTGKGKISEGTASLLLKTYGMNAFDVIDLVSIDASLGEYLCNGRHEILAQVVYGVQKELAVSLTDMMVRRTQLFFKDHNQGLDAIPIMAEKMANLLDWSDEVKNQEIEKYQLEVQRSRAWQTPSNG